MEFTGLTLCYNGYNKNIISVVSTSYGYTISNNNLTLWNFIYNKTDIVLTITPDNYNFGDVSIPYKLIIDSFELSIGSISLNLTENATTTYDSETGILTITLTYSKLTQSMINALKNGDTISVYGEVEEPQAVYTAFLNCEVETNLHSVTSNGLTGYYYYESEIQQNPITLTFSVPQDLNEVYFHQVISDIIVGKIDYSGSEISIIKENITPIYADTNNATLIITKQDIDNYSLYPMYISACPMNINNFYEESSQISEAVLGVNSSASSALSAVNGKLSIPSYFTVISDTPVASNETAISKPYYFRNSTTMAPALSSINTIIFPSTIETIYAPSFQSWNNITDFVFLSTTPPTLSTAIKKKIIGSDTILTGWLNSTANLYVPDLLINA